MPKDKLIQGTSQLLPALELDHLPASLAAQLASADSAEALADASGAAVSGDAAKRIASYLRLAADFERMLANMFVERAALGSAVADANRLVADRIAEQADAAASWNEMMGKIEELEQRRRLQEEEDRIEVEAAQAEVERAINSGDDSQLQTAAERLQKAKQRNAANLDGYSTVQIVLAGYREHAERRETAYREATAAVGQARAEAAQAQFELSALYWDETSTRALAAFLVMQSDSASQSNSWSRLYGSADQSFWVSTHHRAVRWNNSLVNDNQRRGPVNIAGVHLGALVRIVEEGRAAARSLTA